MTSFLELDGQAIFIKPESVVAIETTGGTEYHPHVAGEGGVMVTIPAGVLIRTKGRETNPYVLDCASFESTKEQARILAEKVDAMLNMERLYKTLDKAAYGNPA